MKWLRKKEKLDPTPSLDQQRAEKLASMGVTLREARESKGLTMEEMVYCTRIPQRLLQAIEDGKLEELPEPVYTRGLIRQFSDALGFKGTEFSSSYPLGTNHVSLKPLWKTRGPGGLRQVHFYWLYVGLIVCSVSGLSQALNGANMQANRTTTPKKPEAQPSSQAQANQIQAPGPTQQFQTIAIANNNTQNQVQVGVTLKASSYILVVADGKIQYEGVLPQGSQQTWKAQKELTVKAGNAGGVLVSVNQEQPKQMGKVGETQEMRIAAHTRS